MHKEALQFLASLKSEMDISGVHLKPYWDVDHICYRTSSYEKYVSCKQQFSAIGKLLIESDVNGRPIATYKLNQPITFGEWLIDVVEVPAPKPGKVYTDGFEHIEIVCDEPFSVLCEQYKNLNVDLGGAKKDFNKELQITLASGSIKFHHISLHSVIRLESNKKIYEAIIGTGVLSKFRDLEPVVVGTFPLGVDVAESDVDVLLTAGDLRNIEERLREHFGTFKNFNKTVEMVDGLESIHASFNFNDVAFGVFAQARPSVHQRAFRHFQIEERLLKLGGDNFSKKILELRHAGLKTEPAFARALGFGGDSFLELLRLHSKSNNEIKWLLASSGYQ